MVVVIDVPGFVTAWVSPNFGTGIVPATEIRTVNNTVQRSRCFFIFSVLKGLVN
jgi:hypothetical protein